MPSDVIYSGVRTVSHYVNREHGVGRLHSSLPSSYRFLSTSRLRTSYLDPIKLIV